VKEMDGTSGIAWSKAAALGLSGGCSKDLSIDCSFVSLTYMAFSEPPWN